MQDEEVVPALERINPAGQVTQSFAVLPSHVKQAALQVISVQAPGVATDTVPEYPVLQAVHPSAAEVEHVSHEVSQAPQVLGAVAAKTNPV